MYKAPDVGKDDVGTWRRRRERERARPVSDQYLARFRTAGTIDAHNCILKTWEVEK